mmetsp:Transcript_3439/g.5075  ORF Transcript_3439/g.5075 Transcript_3439/m.5075 type:complete len:106 (+) Transcript_3439:90-407(+)
MSKISAPAMNVSGLLGRRKDDRPDIRVAVDLFLPEFFGLVLEIEADGIDFLITVVETDGGDAITCDLYILEEFIFSLWGGSECLLYINIIDIGGGARSICISFIF